MPKSSKLLSALDREKGRNFKLEKQRKFEKAAAKKKKAGKADEGGVPADGPGLDEAQSDEDSDQWEDAEEEIEENTQTARSKSSAKKALQNGGSNKQLGSLNDKGSEPMEGMKDEEDRAEEEEEEEEGSDGGVPLSDIESLASEERADIIPHQRLTINNTTALLAAHKSIAIPRSVPFVTNMSITSSSLTEIEDVNDDLTRELAFYKQCLEAAVEGRERLKKDGVPFTRPNDYFAEMVKTDEHMGKIKAKMVDEAANKKAAADARKQRDLKKFGKAVQVAKEQERAKTKREMLDKINVLKRKRKDADTGATNEEDMFDIALDNEISKPDRRPKGGKGGTNGSNPKRQKKDAKFGYGGKKRFSKSGDAMSSGDLKGFSAKKMKGKGKKTGAPRPGKSKRAANRF